MQITGEAFPYMKRRTENEVNCAHCGKAHHDFTFQSNDTGEHTFCRRECIELFHYMALARDRRLQLEKLEQKLDQLMRRNAQLHEVLTLVHQIFRHGVEQTQTFAP